MQSTVHAANRSKEHAITRGCLAWISFIFAENVSYADERMRPTAAICLLLLGCAAQKPATRSEASTASPPITPTNERRPRSAVDEALTPSDVQVVIREQLPAVRTCYARNRNVSRTEDKIVVHWVIGKDGKTSDVRIEETTFETPGVGDCLVATIMSWTFPRPTQTVDISFPFVFRAAE
jgi:hypothetical protein